ncbi:hypothetical protein L3X38_010885 [Prunus dulcis]|uniref:Uncharacterized protein n=1 Tax=Prunus dulcis TaxID=3755 RepID=A0AAD4WI01_PRUDU|nr:hypothetical protein L3X38_010885 [Prunus dulcis]
MFPSFRPGWPIEGVFGPSCSRLRRRATTKPLTGLNGKGWIVMFALLTSNQPIDQPSKEPPLDLGSFTSSQSRMVRFRIVYIGAFVSPWAGQ